MSRLECANCRSIFKDVVHVSRCPGCGCKSFSDAEAGMGAIRIFPKWFTYQGNFGFFSHRTMRTDVKEGTIRIKD